MAQSDSLCAGNIKGELTVTSSINNSSIGPRLDFGRLARFIPEPTTRAGTSFSSVLNGITGVLGRVAGAALGGSSGGIPGLSPEYVTLIEKQIETQMQMQLMTFHSNIEKSQHETKMTALRNVRVG